MNKLILTIKGNHVVKHGGGPALKIKDNHIISHGGGNSYKIKGKHIYKHGGGTVLKIKGNHVYEHGGGPLLKIKGNFIYKHGGGAILQVKGKHIYQRGDFPIDTNLMVAVLIATGKINASGKGACFIATATMGDFNHPVVMQLREFRDQYLLKRNWGRKFTQYYYKFGLYPAKVISKSNLLKKVSYIFIVKPLFIIAQEVMKIRK